MTYNLSDAVRDEGYTFVIDSAPGCRPDILGCPCWSCNAAACRGKVIACTADSWDYGYECAHEIAEDNNGFWHCENTWTDQCNIMHRWLKKLSLSKVVTVEQPERHVLLKWVMCLAYALFLVAIAIILGDN